MKTDRTKKDKTRMEHSDLAEYAEYADYVDKYRLFLTVGFEVTSVNIPAEDIVKT